MYLIYSITTITQDTHTHARAHTIQKEWDMWYFVNPHLLFFFLIFLPPLHAWVQRKLTRRNERRKRSLQKHIEIRYLFLVLGVLRCIVKIDGKVVYDKSSAKIYRKLWKDIKCIKKKTWRRKCRNISHNNFFKSKIHTKFQEFKNYEFT